VARQCCCIVTAQLSSKVLRLLAGLLLLSLLWLSDFVLCC
jgi:hypothetical protein